MSDKKKRGFAAMTHEQRKEIASKGGKSAHKKGKAHKFTSEKAREAGIKGGKSISQNREYMAEIGRKGGLKRQELLRKRSIDLGDFNFYLVTGGGLNSLIYYAGYDTEKVKTYAYATLPITNTEVLKVESVQFGDIPENEIIHTANLNFKDARIVARLRDED